MKKIILLLLIFLLPVLLTAGKFSFAVTPGFGFYSMKTLQKLQNDIIIQKIKDYHVDYKTVENYPGNVFFAGEARYQYKSNHFIGVGYQYHSTAARLSYKDYSGELRTDLLNETSIFYLLYNRKYIVTENFAITLLINYNLLFTNMDFIDYTQLGDDITTEKIKCNSFAHALSVGFDFSQTIDAFEIGLRISFLHDMNNLLISGDYFYDRGGKSETFGETEAEWNGIRAGLIFAYHL